MAPISTVELTGEEIVAMLEKNLERTFARDPYDQMGGYVKRSLGFNVYIKIENPPGQRVQQVLPVMNRCIPGAIIPRLLLPNRASRASTGATANSTPSGA